MGERDGYPVPEKEAEETGNAGATWQVLSFHSVAILRIRAAPCWGGGTSCLGGSTGSCVPRALRG